MAVWLSVTGTYKIDEPDNDTELHLDTIALHGKAANYSSVNLVTTFGTASHAVISDYSKEPHHRRSHNLAQVHIRGTQQ
jgi:hypothetical protein